MCDSEDEDIPEEFSSLREKEISDNVSANFEVLSQKTINFEDLLSELINMGCLSFEDKYKIGVEAGDDPKAGKASIMYSILMKKGISWRKVAQAWEETGNNYLLGRFDTRFVFVGQASKKSQKLTKFKSLPSHRTEFLTHLYLKHVQISPKSLLKCLRKSSKMEMIRLEHIKLPTGGAYGIDPSADFDQFLVLPNVKDFYLEDVSLEPFKSIKEIGMFLDELNLRNLIFFGSNPVQAWENHARIHVKLRTGNILRMVTDQEIISMCRRKPTDYGGFFHPHKVNAIALYESYIPKNALACQLTKLVLYRCRVPDLTPLVGSCDCLIECALYGEHETTKLSQVDLSAFLTGGKCSLLRRLSLGFCNISYSGEENSSNMILFSLDFLCFDCCAMDEEFANEFTRFFQSSKNITWICGKPHLGLELFKEMLSFSTLETLTVGHLSWEDAGDELKDEVIQSIEGLGENERNFILTRTEDGCGLLGNWEAKTVGQLDEFNAIVFECFKWDYFCDYQFVSNWFNLPCGTSEKEPREFFCNVSSEF